MVGHGKFSVHTGIDHDRAPGGGAMPDALTGAADAVEWVDASALTGQASCPVKEPSLCAAVGLFVARRKQDHSPRVLISSPPAIQNYPNP